MARTATIERKTTEAKWYMCPECKGTAWVESNQRFKVLDGVRKLGHIPCPRCNGARMIQSQRAEEDGTPLSPVKLCPKCKNWYAVGGGHPKRDPCPSNHAAAAPGKTTCCHWHDLSMPVPGRKAGIRLTPVEPIEWQETAQTQ